MRPPITHSVPTSASLRALIDEVLSDDVDFEAFCLDYFPEVQRRFSEGMQHPQKVTLLLRHAHRREVLECICQKFAKRAEVANWHGKVEWEQIEVATIPLLKKKRVKRLQKMLLGAVLWDWLSRFWFRLGPEGRMIAIGAILMVLSGYGITVLTSSPVVNPQGPSLGRRMVLPTSLPPGSPEQHLDNHSLMSTPPDGTEWRIWMNGLGSAPRRR